MTINFSSFKNLQGIILGTIIFLVFISAVLAFFNSRSEANDQKRITDIRQIQAGLKVYFDINGFYPQASNGEPKGITSYLDFWPKAPAAGGGCSTAENSYNYSPQANGADYSVAFCLANKNENLAAGAHKLSSKEIQ